MTAALETRVGSHGTIRIEMTPSDEGLREAGALQKAAQAAQGAFDEAMDTARTIARGVVEQLVRDQEIGQPNKVELEFGIKLSTEAGAIVAKAAAEGHFKVSLTWESRNH